MLCAAGGRAAWWLSGTQDPPEPGGSSRQRAAEPPVMLSLTAITEDCSLRWGPKRVLYYAKEVRSHLGLCFLGCTVLGCHWTPFALCARERFLSHPWQWCLRGLNKNAGASMYTNGKKPRGLNPILRVVSCWAQTSMRKTRPPVDRPRALCSVDPGAGVGGPQGTQRCVWAEKERT